MQRADGTLTLIYQRSKFWFLERFWLDPGHNVCFNNGKLERFLVPLKPIITGRGAVRLKSYTGILMKALAVGVGGLKYYWTDEIPFWIYQGVSEERILDWKLWCRGTSFQVYVKFRILKWFTSRETWLISRRLSTSSRNIILLNDRHSSRWWSIRCPRPLHSSYTIPVSFDEYPITFYVNFSPIIAK